MSGSIGNKASTEGGVFFLVMSSMKEEVASLLNKKVRISVDDGRILEGLLHCIDKDMNIVLAHGVEYHNASDIMAESLDTKTTRNVGSVMIPGSHIQEIACSSSQEE